MKKTFLLVATALSVTVASAQISIAPELGLNLANWQRKIGDEKPNGGLKLGVKAGANVNIPIGNNLAVQPGLFYSIKGMKTSEDNDKNNITLHYAEIPVNIVYMFNDPSEGRFFVGVGPYLGVAFSGKNLTTNSRGVDTNESLTFGSGKDQNLARIDYGAQVLVGYLLRSGIFFRGAYQQGIANLVPSEYGNRDKLSIRNTCFTISVGYMLSGAPKDKGAAMKGSQER